MPPRLRDGVRIESVRAAAYTIPTDQPEADGTISWDSTTLVVVEVAGGGQTGLGYSYSGAAVVGLIEGKLAEHAQQHDALDPPAAWRAMQRAVRKMGREGLAASAIAAVDTALWDLKAKLLGLAVAADEARRSSGPVQAVMGWPGADAEGRSPDLLITHHQGTAADTGHEDQQSGDAPPRSRMTQWGGPCIKSHPLIARIRESLRPVSPPPVQARSASDGHDP
jgi:hypothetical protein